MSHKGKKPSSEHYYVLDDQEKVEKVKDRGESFYPEHVANRVSLEAVAMTDNNPREHIATKLFEALPCLVS